MWLLPDLAGLPTVSVTGVVDDGDAGLGVHVESTPGLVGCADCGVVATGRDVAQGAVQLAERFDSRRQTHGHRVNDHLIRRIASPPVGLRDFKVHERLCQELALGATHNITA